jgi:hypothetical protein
MKTAFAGIGVLLLIVGGFGFLGFHLYTSWLANKEFGAFWGMVVFSSPPVGDLYWVVHTIAREGLFCAYTYALAAIFAAVGAGQLLLERSDG